MFNLMDAIISLGYGDEITSIVGNTYDGIQWIDGPKCTEEELENEIVRLTNEYELIKYKKLRAFEYPSIGDQLDALYHAGVFPPEMAQKIKEVKDKYPKPSTN